jgi:hypothetical protein
MMPYVRCTVRTVFRTYGSNSAAVQDDQKFYGAVRMVFRMYGSNSAAVQNMIKSSIGAARTVFRTYSSNS